MGCEFEDDLDLSNEMRSIFCALVLMGARLVLEKHLDIPGGA